MSVFVSFFSKWKITVGIVSNTVGLYWDKVQMGIEAIIMPLWKTNSSRNSCQIATQKLCTPFLVLLPTRWFCWFQGHASKHDFEGHASATKIWIYQSMCSLSGILYPNAPQCPLGLVLSFWSVEKKTRFFDWYSWLLNRCDSVAGSCKDWWVLFKGIIKEKARFRASSSCGCQLTHLINMMNRKNFSHTLVDWITQKFDLHTSDWDISNWW